MKEVQYQKEFVNNNYNEFNQKMQNFEFSDFTTFSKNENQNNFEMMAKHSNLYVLTTASSNNLNKKQHIETDLISFKDGNSQYISIRSNNTLNNYCSIHQINGNFQTQQDHEFNQLSKLKLLFFYFKFIYILSDR